MKVTLKGLREGNAFKNIEILLGRILRRVEKLENKEDKPIEPGGIDLKDKEFLDLVFKNTTPPVEKFIVSYYVKGTPLSDYNSTALYFFRNGIDCNVHDFFTKENLNDYIENPQLHYNTILPDELEGRTLVITELAT